MARRYSTYTWTEVCAFWGMVVAAFTRFFGEFFKSLVKWIFGNSSAGKFLHQAANVLTLLGNIALVVAIALPAFQFVRFKSKGWKVFYWIAFTLFLISVVFGYVLEAHLR